MAQKVRILDWIFYIHYSLQFQKNKEVIKGLIDLGSEVNAITLTYARQLNFWTQKINVRTEKIDGLLLKTFVIVIIAFQVIDKLDRVWFF